MTSKYISRRLIVSQDEGPKIVQDRDAPKLGQMVIVLAEPGGGKTALAEELAKEESTHLVSASLFANAIGSQDVVAASKLLVVDGLDEVAGRRWGDGVDHVLAQLYRLNLPRTLITCRAAEWEGARNKSFIRELYGEEPIEAHFEPFSTDEIVELIEKFEPKIDGWQFFYNAQDRDLGDMLSNPESLRLLLSSVSNGKWPNSRSELFELATSKAIQETNDRHKTSGSASNQELLEAAGEIFASVLISGASGVSNVRDDVPEYVDIREFGGRDKNVYAAAIQTRLFRSTGETRLMPAHRMVAEYLAGRWLATQLNSGSLSARRLAAALAPDGFVRTDLRGLHAWLATLGNAEFRRRAIARDPYGILRYGDSTNFLADEKRQLLRQLCKLAEEDPYFRAAEGWTRPMILGFLDLELRPDVIAILTDAQSNFHLNTLLLSALRGSPVARELTGELLQIAKDENRPFGERSDASHVLEDIPELDLSDLVDTLRLRRTEDSARLSLQIIANREGLGFEPELIGNALSDAVLIKSADRDADLSTLDHSLVKRIPSSIIGSVLDQLSKRMVPMCDGKLRYSCGCIRAISPTVVRLLEKLIAEQYQLPTADQLWRWLRKLNTDQYVQLKTKAISAALQSNDVQRRGVQAKAIRSNEFEESAWLALFRLGEIVEGLTLSPADVVYHLEELVSSGLSSENIERWSDLVQWGRTSPEVVAIAERHSSEHAELATRWQKINQAPKASPNERRHRKLQRQWELKEKAQTRQRLRSFDENRSRIEAGTHTGWLTEIAKAFVASRSGRPEDDSLADLVGKDGVKSAIVGLRAVVLRNDLPTIEEIVQAHCEEKYWPIEHAICGGLIARMEAGLDLSGLSQKTLDAAYASQLFGAYFNDRQEMRDQVEDIVFATGDMVESFARRYFEPQMKHGLNSVNRLESILLNKRFSSSAGDLALEWLEKYPDIHSSIQRQLLDAAILFGDLYTVRKLVRRRCAELQNIEQCDRHGPEYQQNRAIWIPASFLLDFEFNKSMISRFAAEERERIWAFSGFVFPEISIERRGEIERWPSLGVDQNRFLLELFASSWPPADHPRSGWTGDRNPWDAHEFLRRCGQAIGSSDDPNAGEALNALIDNEGAAHHRDELLHLRAGWLARQRESSVDVPSFKAVQSIVRGQGPCTIVDLQAMMIDALSWLQDDMRDGDTKGYRWFWNGNEPHHENDCRDLIIDRIRPRFEAANTQLRSEGRMPNDKRADIVVSFVHEGETHDLPVEVKGQWHGKLWTAAVEQLDTRYARYIHARGRGIYLVLWFGRATRKKLPPRSDMKNLPDTPDELLQMLRSDLPDALRHRLEIFVLDLSKPTS